MQVKDHDGHGQDHDGHGQDHDGHVQNLGQVQDYGQGADGGQGEDHGNGQAELMRRLSNRSNSSTATFQSVSSLSSFRSAISVDAEEEKRGRGRPVGARNRPIEDRLRDATSSFEGSLPRRSPRKPSKEAGFYTEY